MAPVTDLVVISGPPGSGKSTVAELVADRFEPSAVVTGDEFFHFLRRGYVDAWRPAAHEQNRHVVAAAAAATGRLAQWATVVYDGVIGPWFVDDFARSAGVESLSYVVLLPPLEVCLERVSSRVGHDFDDPEATRHMHAQFADADLEERHVLRAADGTADDVAAAVADLVAAGSATYRVG